MAHRYVISVDIDGESVDIPSIVPGNEKLQKDVQKAQDEGTKARKPTRDEVDTAVGYFKKQKAQKKNSLVPGVSGAFGLMIERAQR